MIKSTSTILGGALALLCMTGCNSGGGSGYQPKAINKAEVATVDPNTGRAIWPLKVGNSWTYAAETLQSIGAQQNKREFDVTFTVKSVEPTANGERVILESVDSTNPDKPVRQMWLVTDKSISQIYSSSADKSYSPPQPAIIFPLTPGNMVKYKGKGPNPVGTIGDQELEIKVLTPTIVDTAMGRMTGIGVESMGTWKGTVRLPDGKQQPVNGILRTTSYFAPNIGLIRFTQETAFGQVAGTQTLRLKSHTIKN